MQSDTRYANMYISPAAISQFSFNVVFAFVCGPRIGEQAIRINEAHTLLGMDTGPPSGDETELPDALPISGSEEEQA